MIPTDELKFIGGYLRPLCLEDIHSGYIEGLNDPEVNIYLDGVNRSKQNKKSISDFIRVNVKSNNSILWGIWLDDHKLHCGTLRIHDIDGYHRCAHIGVCIFNKSAWGMRIGSKAIFAATEWAIKNLNLRWIEAGIYQENITSQKAFIAAGYELIFDVSGKYLLNGKPSVVKIYAARQSLS